MATEELPDGQVPRFDIKVLATRDSGQVCVRLKGELDIATAPVARDRIAALKHLGDQLVLDLRGLSFIDSAGLKLVLWLAAESTREAWKLTLIPGSTVVQRIFQLTGTQERLTFSDPRANGKHPALVN
jgi:anti-anti-sigma factor